MTHAIGSWPAQHRPDVPPLHVAWRYTRKVAKRGLALAILGYVSTSLLVLYLITGAYDVVRYGRNLAETSRRYFLLGGSLTWLFSPINTLIDILCLPDINKMIYRLDDFPAAYRKEIEVVTEHCDADEIVADVTRRRGTDDRTMLLYKWYGYDNPAAKNEHFNRDYDYILTVGVSTFRAQTKTKRHFGWLRAGIRVLYNIDAATDPGAYIIVNGERHTWSEDGPLFIFDDTVLHQSFNLTDRDRHCLFIDVLRPSHVPFLLRGFVKFLGFVSTRMPYFRKSSNWRLL